MGKVYIVAQHGFHSNAQKMWQVFVIKENFRTVIFATDIVFHDRSQLEQNLERLFNVGIARLMFIPTK